MNPRYKTAWIKLLIFFVFLLGSSDLSRASVNENTIKQNILTSSVTSSVSPSGRYSIDLHNHVFMKEGGNWLIRGSFNEKLTANSWDSRLGTKSNKESLLKSNAAIVVVSIYANELFGNDLRDSVRAQIKATQDFVTSNNNWILATNAPDARNALSKNKQVLLLSLEGAAGVIETEEDITEFIKNGGISIVTPLHFVDDDFGGAAFMMGKYAALNPLSLIESFLNPKKSEGIRVNKQGLKKRGKWLIEKLIQNKVWIDLSHASDESQKEIIPILRRHSQPLLYTHTSIRKFFKAERAISEDQLREVRKSGGIIGLFPSEKYLEGTPAASCPLGVINKNDCAGTVHALVTQFNHASEIIGPESTLIGTDFNAPLKHLKPAFKTRTSLDHWGFWNMSQFEDLWVSLSRSGAKLPENKSDILDNFLSKWEKSQANLPSKRAL